MDKRKSTAKAPAKQARTIQVPLSAITITWETNKKKRQLTGAQVTQILDVMRWSDTPREDPEEPSNFWPLQTPSSLGYLIRGITQATNESAAASEPDCAENFLASAQMFLAACLIGNRESNDGQSRAPEFYHLEIPAAAAAGGAR